MLSRHSRPSEAMIEYPNVIQNDEAWKSVWTTFSKITAKVPGSKLSGLSKKVAQKPYDISGLYDFGYQLIEEGLPAVAAIVLRRANGILPESLEIVLELAIALESIGYHEDACKVLGSFPGVEEDLLTYYLYTYNTIMAGDWEKGLSMVGQVNALFEKSQKSEELVNLNQNIINLKAKDTVSFKGNKFRSSGLERDGQPCLMVAFYCTYLLMEKIP